MEEHSWLLAVSFAAVENGGSIRTNKSRLWFGLTGSWFQDPAHSHRDRPRLSSRVVARLLNRFVKRH